MKDGLECAGGNCGLVRVPAIEAPPPPEKIAEAVVPKGHFRMRSSVHPRPSRGRKWTDIQIEDLQSLGRLADTSVAARVVGPAISGAPAVLAAKTNYMRMGAMFCRMFRSTPPAQAGIWQWAATFRDELFPEFFNPPDEMDDLDWLNSMPKRRQAPLRLAYILYKRGGWDSKYKRFTVFIKEELLAGFDKDEYGLIPLRTLVARLIYAPHDVTHIIGGPKIKPFMEWLKRQWTWENWVFYGGTTPEYLQLWLDRFSSSSLGPRLYFWSDLSQFESTHCLDTWEFIESFYWKYKDHHDFQACLAAWKQMVGTCGSDFKFVGRIGVNASGRPDTAFANAVLNCLGTLLAITAAWLQKPLRQVEISDLRRMQSDLLVSFCGDDTLGSLPWVEEGRAIQFVQDSKANLIEFGFKAKFFASDRLEDCVYLAHRPLCVAGRWYWAKTLGRCLYKLGYQVKQSGDPRAHFMGIADMYIRCAGHVPVLSDICRQWVACNPGAKISRPKLEEECPWQMAGLFGPAHYDDSTLEAVARAYTVNRRPCRTDLSPQDVMVTASDVSDCIQYVKDTIQGVPCVLDHWLLRHMVWVDEE